MQGEGQVENLKLVIIRGTCLRSRSWRRSSLLLSIGRGSFHQESDLETMRCFWRIDCLETMRCFWRIDCLETGKQMIKKRLASNFIGNECALPGNIVLLAAVTFYSSGKLFLVYGRRCADNFEAGAEASRDTLQPIPNGEAH